MESQATETESFYQEASCSLLHTAAHRTHSTVVYIQCYAMEQILHNPVMRGLWCTSAGLCYGGEGHEGFWMCPRCYTSLGMSLGITPSH